MALNDIKISELPLLLEADITEETILVVVKEDLNYQVTVGALSAKALDHFYDQRPLGEISLTAAAPAQDFTDVEYTIVTAFDKIQFERGVNCDLPSDSIILLEDGNYKVSISAVAEFDKNSSLDLAVMVNGVVSESFGNIQGLGAGKGTQMGGADVDPMVIGDVIQLAAKRGELGSVSVVFVKARIIVSRV